MPEITLTITDTQARVLTALEKIDGLSASDRMQPYFRDQTCNRAGIKSDEPAFVEQGLILLEDQAVLAMQARELEAQRVKDEQDAVLVTDQQKAPAPIQVNEPDAPLPLFELTPPPTTDEAPQVITEI